MPATKAKRAPKKTGTKKAAAKKAPVEDEEDEELEGLDEELAALESATDLDDLDIEEEEPEDEEDDEEEAAPTKRKKTASKKKTPPANEEDDEEDDEDEEEEEDDEDDGLDEMDRGELKAYIKDNEVDLGETVKKSWSDDDIRERIRGASDGEDEEDEEDEEISPAPAKKGRGRPKGSGSKPAREKSVTEEAILSADDVACIGGLAEHQVRGFARKYPKAFPKDTPKSKYKFNVRQAHALLKGLGALSD